MTILPLAQKLTSISTHVQVLLYADDLLIIITGGLDSVVYVNLLAWSSILAFSRYPGLPVNCTKSAILLKGSWNETHQTQMLPLDCPSKIPLSILEFNSGLSQLSKPILTRFKKRWDTPSQCNHGPCNFQCVCIWLIFGFHHYSSTLHGWFFRQKRY